jgi:imidazolonepropionase-like amidohydrolase
VRARAIICVCIALLSVAQAQTATYAEGPTLAFRDVDVFDGTRMLRHVNVLVAKGMIQAVGASAAIPASAMVVEGQGKTLLPGLIDSHTHLGGLCCKVLLAA